MKYSLDRDKYVEYYFDAINNPYMIELKLKELMLKIDFINGSRVKSKIDKDGLYSFSRDSFKVFLTISNAKYIAYLLKESQTIEDIIRSWIPHNFDVSYEIVYDEEG